VQLIVRDGSHGIRSTAVEARAVEEIEQGHAEGFGVTTIVRFPPTFFAIAFGLFGLAGIWRVGARAFGMPIAIGDSLAILAAIVYLGLLAAFVAKAVVAPARVANEMKNPVLSAFYSLAALDALLLAVNLREILGAAAWPILIVALVVGCAYAAWVTATWIMRDERKPDDLHYGYLLPTVAMGLLGGDALAFFGMPQIGTMFFGVGVLCWLVLASMIGFRMISVAPRIVAALMPTLAIELAPPAVAGNAYLSITGGHIDTVVLILAGYSVFLALQQLVLITMYCKLTFFSGFWSFTFPWAATAIFSERLSIASHQPTVTVIAGALTLAVTLLIAVIAVRSIVEIVRGTFVPKPV